MRLQLRSQADPALISALRGRRAERKDFSLVLHRESPEPVRVHAPDGSLLCVVLRQALSEGAAARAYPFLHELRRYYTRNRGHFSAQQRYRVIREDGFTSKDTWTDPVPSSVVGALDPQGGRYPYCRLASFVTKYPELWGEALPMIQETARVMKREVPDAYKRQMEAASHAHPYWVLPETPFTTLTVNNTYSGGYHTDAGDFKAGFGAMSVLRRGHYHGCELVFPAYGLAVDMGDRDLILFDSHAVHGNADFYETDGLPGPEAKGASLDWSGVFHERISIVHYFREKVLDCLGPVEELEKARARGMLAPDDKPDDEVSA
jgi:hypothetical protein